MLNRHIAPGSTGVRHSRRSVCHRIALAAATFLSVSSGHRASAQAGDVAVAESLFREGKERMAAKDYERACPRLADSLRLDPATGTMLALAICHERAGKLASAWAEYADAAARSRHERRPDREKAAREKVAALEPRLSFLTISPSVAATETPGIEITRNGVLVGAGTLATAVPVDGGTYSIGASAPGKKTWRTQLRIASSGERHTVTVPALESETDAPLASSAPKPAAIPPKARLALAAPLSAEQAAIPAGETPQADSAKGGSGYGAFAAATIAAGVAGIGIGTVFALQAIAKNEDSKSGCDGDRCSPAATQDRLDARSFGNAATIGFLAGGAFLAAGTTLYLVGSPSKASRAPSSATLDATPLVAPGALGGVLRGKF